MSIARPIAALLLLAVAACGDNSDSAGGADTGPTVHDAGITDAAPIDAATLDAATQPITDAAPRPDAIPGFTCSAPIALAPGESQLGDTGNYFDSNSANCSPGSLSAKDVIYRIPLPAEPTDLIARVTIDTDAPIPFDAVLAIQTECGVESTEQACSDFGFSESAEALGLTDEAFVVVDGTAQFGASSEGRYQIDVSTRAIVADQASCDPAGITSRCADGFLCVASACRAETAQLACGEATALVPGLVQDAQIHAFQNDFTQGSCAFDATSGAGETIFSFSLAAAADVTLSTDLPGTDFDTVVYLRATCDGAELACADDVDASASNFRSRLEAAALPAGDYLVFVDGASTAAPTGRLSIRLDVAPL